MDLKEFIQAVRNMRSWQKAYFERLRPCWDQNMVDGGLHILEGKGNLYGFYSEDAGRIRQEAGGIR